MTTATQGARHSVCAELGILQRLRKQRPRLNSASPPSHYTAFVQHFVCTS
jgi:hypothetical protein